jgi:Fe-S cluster biogenesis protein NfuA
VIQTEFQEVDDALASIRPAMQADGGNVELVEVNDGVVTVRLVGTCIACPSKNLTLRLGIERRLKAHLPWVRDVVRVD